jgi:hypothetical protein
MVGEEFEGAESGGRAQHFVGRIELLAPVSLIHVSGDSAEQSSSSSSSTGQESIDWGQELLRVESLVELLLGPQQDSDGASNGLELWNVLGGKLPGPPPLHDAELLEQLFARQSSRVGMDTDMGDGPDLGSGSGESVGVENVGIFGAVVEIVDSITTSVQHGGQRSAVKSSSCLVQQYVVLAAVEHADEEEEEEHGRSRAIVASVEVVAFKEKEFNWSMILFRHATVPAGNKSWQQVELIPSSKTESMMQHSISCKV